jgi:D-sedoheptulose 7-phosphate isomerase
MLEQRAQQQFFDSADSSYQGAEVLARPVAAAAGALTAAITAGGKVLAGGSGAGHWLAQRFVGALVEGLDRERPPLAALALAPPPAPAAQVQALGQPGDVLLWVGDADEATAAAALEAAAARELTIVLLRRRGPAPPAALRLETDVLIEVPHEREARVLELQLLVLHALADALDMQLMGEPES